MLSIKPMDPSVPIFNQLDSNQEPVTLVNLFEVAEEDIPAMMKAWEADANWMKKQPGYISTQMHQAIAGSSVFLNIAVWESTEQFKAAFTHPEFQETLAAYPSSAVAAPHLFSAIKVSGLCLGDPLNK